MDNPRRQNSQATHSKANLTYEDIIKNFRNGYMGLPFAESTIPELKNGVVDFYRSKPELRDDLDLNLLKRGALLAHDRDNLKLREFPPDETCDQTPHDNHQPNGQGIGDESISNPTQTRGIVTGQSSSPRISDESFITYSEDRAEKRERYAELSSLTKSMKVLIGTCALGAIVQGWSQESIVGANMNWPVDLGIATKSHSGLLDFDDNHGLEKFGLVNATPYWAASVIGAWVSDPVTDRLGRRAALFFAALCSLASPIFAAYCHTWWQLLLCRTLQGIGIGSKSSVVPVILSETAPTLLRGKILVSWQTFTAFGIFLGACADCIFQGHWRVQIGMSFLPSVSLVFLCYVIPESPRWLVKKERYQEAYRALRDLRETQLQAARDLYVIHSQLEIENSFLSWGRNAEHPPNLAGVPAQHSQEQQNAEALAQERSRRRARHPGFFSRTKQLFMVGRSRRAVYAACVAMIAQQLSGINVFAFLGSTIFGDTHIDEMENLQWNLAFAATNFIFSALAFFMVDQVKRRNLLLWSLLLMFPFLLGMGYIMDAKEGDASQPKWVISFVVVYTAAYSFGAGVIPFMYSSEVFPLVHREVGMSLACAVTFALAGVLAMAVPQYSNSLENDHFKLFGAFAGCDAFAAILVWLFVRSPGDAVPLEDMNFLFIGATWEWLIYRFKISMVGNIKRLFGICGESRRRQSIDQFEDWYEDRRRTRRRTGIELGPRG